MCDKSTERQQREQPDSRAAASVAVESWSRDSGNKVDIGKNNETSIAAGGYLVVTSAWTNIPGAHSELSAARAPQEKQSPAQKAPEQPLVARTLERQPIQTAVARDVRRDGAGLSLDRQQEVNLRRLINTDADASRQAQKLVKSANGYLDDRPHPIPVVHVEGTLKSSPVAIRSRAALEDMKKVDTLTDAYELTGDRKYGEKSKSFVLAWARTHQPNGNPIDETNLEPMLKAFDATRSLYTSDEKRQVDRWLTKIADQAIAHDGKVTQYNNWNSHRLKIVGMIGFIKDDDRLIDYAVNGYKKQVAHNIRPDGSTYDFHVRDALHYHVYDLEPLLGLARVAEKNGVNLYDYKAQNGASLDKAVRFLEPYANGSKRHIEFRNSQVGFDKDRQRAGQPEFDYKAFDPARATKVFELASGFNHRYDGLANKLNGGNTHSNYPSWRSVMTKLRA